MEQRTIEQQQPPPTLSASDGNTDNRERPARPHFLSRLLLLALMISVFLALHASPLQAQPAARKPDLYVLTIAVGEYQHSGIPDLEYPDDDALAIRTWASEQKGKLYETIHVDQLTQAQATRSAIIQKIVEFFRPAHPNDQLILYLAGHGVVLEERRSWHFLPVEADPNALEATALEQDDILEKLENPSRPHKRVLVLIDTCQAGALANSVSPAADVGSSPMVTRGGRGLKLGADLTLSSNDVENRTSLWLVFGAGTSSDKAEEGPQFKLPTDPQGVKGHGVFTWALLQALASQQADGDKSGTVTLSEFVQHVSREVSKATQNRQMPVMSGRFMDVPLGFAPGSIEICDGRDNDLDGVIDNGFDENQNKIADCLESEVCNGKDDNNNGIVDEGFDLDGDGYASREKCGSVIGTDCDDKALTIHPNQEDWGNLRDDDCDGMTDEDDFDRNKNGKPDTAEKRLKLSRALQLGGLGLGLGMLGGTVWTHQQLQALSQLPDSEVPEDYLTSAEQKAQYATLYGLRAGMASVGALSLGLSATFTFYGHELRGRLPHPWKSPHDTSPQPEEKKSEPNKPEPEAPRSSSPTSPDKPQQDPSPLSTAGGSDTLTSTPIQSSVGGLHAK